MNRLLFGDNLQWLHDVKLFPDAFLPTMKHLITMPPNDADPSKRKW